MQLTQNHPSNATNVHCWHPHHYLFAWNCDVLNAHEMSKQTKLTSRWVDFKTTHQLDGCIQNLHIPIHQLGVITRIHHQWIQLNIIPNTKFQAHYCCLLAILHNHYTFLPTTPLVVGKQLRNNVQKNDVIIPKSFTKLQWQT